MLRNLKLILSTIRYLKPIQVKYQIFYRLNQPKNISAYRSKVNLDFRYLKFIQFPPAYNHYLGDNAFIFLNIEWQFEKNIDWNFQKFGKLWNYNLQYGSYLLQNDVSIEDKLRLLRSLYQSLNAGNPGLEPYPSSLRTINIIRFFSKEKLDEKDILENVHGELQFLSKRPEFHLLGNHLLENGFALMMGGAFFGDERWIQQGENILVAQLEEQILVDGAHFELSPMYHQIILFRLLELVDWYSKFESRKVSFLEFIVAKAERLCAWLKNMSFANGDIPHFNDSAEGITFHTNFLLDYAKQLNIESKEILLSDSGYRSINRDGYECRIDFAQIGPSYQPGHAHADALSFVLNYKGQPVFVEQGTSTYEIGERRNLERSTSAHNTVVVNNKNQSEVWGRFRVAARAKTVITCDDTDKLEAYHTGYKKAGIIHKRMFQFLQGSIDIHDELTKDARGVFYLHLHPNTSIKEETSTTFLINENIGIIFAHANKIDVEEYLFSMGYNKYEKSKRFIIDFFGTLNTTIRFD